MARIYYPGSTAHLTVSFTSSGVATDPTTVTLKVMHPSGTIDTYTYAGATVTKDSTGNYSKNVTFDVEGTWKWRWVGTGTVADADEGEIEVKRSAFV